MKQLHIITGQTATGKTKRAIALAQELHGEIINADSRQIYKHLDIVTGKDKGNSVFVPVYKQGSFDIGYYPLADESSREVTKIWLYDIVEPDNPFSSHDFVTCIVPLITDMWKRGVTPIIVGGTYLYLSHLLYGVSSSAGPNWELRKELEGKTVEELQQVLSAKAPGILETMNESDMQNPRRLMRKIELAEAGETALTHHNYKYAVESLFQDPVEVVFEGIAHSSKESMYKLLEQRVIQRLQEGALEETSAVMSLYPSTCPGLQSIGYPECITFLRGEASYDNLVETWTTHEAQYAKRQVTFMKKDPNIAWISL